MPGDDKTRWVRGGKTTAKPKGGKRAARASRLYEEASRRLVRLFEHGANGDRLARKPIPVRGHGARRALEQQNRFAQMSLPERIAFVSASIDRLKAELERVESTATQRTRALTIPAILTQIDEVEAQLTDLIQELNEAPRTISRQVGDISVIDPDDSELTPEQYAARVDEQQRRYEEEES